MNYSRWGMPAFSVADRHWPTVGQEEVMGTGMGCNASNEHLGGGF